MTTEDQPSAEPGPASGADGDRRRRPARVRAVDFSRPTKFLQEQQRKFLRAHETACRTISTRLSAELRTPVELDVLAIDQLAWASALAEVPQPSVLAIVDVHPIGSRLLLTAELDALLRMVDRLLGGDGRPAGGEERAMTEIEQRLARRIFESMLEQLTPIWDELLGLRLSLVELETKAMNVQIAPPSEPTLTLTIEQRLEQASSTVSIVVPYRSIEPVVDRLDHSLADGLAGHAAPPGLRNALAEVPVEVRAEVGAVEPTLAEVLAFGVGTIVPLRSSVDVGVTLYADDVPIQRAHHLGRARGPARVQPHHGQPPRPRLAGRRRRRPRDRLAAADLLPHDRHRAARPRRVRARGARPRLSPPMEINQRLIVRTARHPGVLTSRVEHADESQADRLAIATPARDGEIVELATGDGIELEWTEDEVTRTIRATVLGDANLRIPAVIVELVGESRVVQRRDNVRLPVSLGLSVWEIVGEDDEEPPPMIGSVFDLSGGGMQARIPRRLHLDDRFWLRFELPERGVVETEAVVRRHIAGDVYGLEFVGLPPADRERIIRTIFAIMREQLARRSGRGA